MDSFWHLYSEVPPVWALYPISRVSPAIHHCLAEEQGLRLWGADSYSNTSHSAEDHSSACWRSRSVKSTDLHHLQRVDKQFLSPQIGRSLALSWDPVHKNPWITESVEEPWQSPAPTRTRWSTGTLSLAFFYDSPNNLEMVKSWSTVP